MNNKTNISKQVLSKWEEELIHINHHGTLIQREIEAGKLKRATELSERSRKRVWKLLNELFENGANKPKNYCEPGYKLSGEKIE